MIVNPQKTGYQRSFLVGLAAGSILMLTAAVVLTRLEAINRPVVLKADKNIYSAVWYKRIELPPEEYPVENYRHDDCRDNMEPAMMLKPINDLTYADFEKTLLKGYQSADYDAGPFGIKREGPAFADKTGRPLPMQNKTLSLADISTEDKYPIRRSGKTPDRPLYIKLRGIDIPHKAFGVVDTVIVLLDIDSNANIRNIETIYDSHPGLGFDISFKKALREAYIMPEVTNGRPTGGQYYLYHIWGGSRAGIRNTDDIYIEMARTQRSGN